MNKFLKDLEKELRKHKVNPKEIEEILADHKEMIEAAKQEGLSDDEISLKFGDPLKVATEIYEDSKTEDTEIDFNLGDVDSLAKFDTDDFNFVKAFTLVPEGLDLNFSLVNDDLIFSDYDGEGIKIYEKGIKDLDDYEFTLNDNQFTLKRKSTKKVFKVITFSSNGGKFLVLVPKGLKSKSFNFHTVSGDVVINQLIVNDFRLKSTNGDIELSNIDLGEAKFSLVNGDVEIQGMKATSFDVSLVNGDIEIEKAQVKGNMQFNSVSGDVELKEVECDTASFKTVSGDVEGKNFYVNELSLKSISGDVNIDNDDKSREIIVKSKKTLSGDVKINK